MLLPDNDEAGRKFAQHMAPLIRPLVKRLQIIHLPDLEPKGDITDWLDSGHTTLDLQRLRSNTPMWRAPRKRRKRHGFSGRVKRRRKYLPGIPYDVGDITYELGGHLSGGDRGMAYCPAHDDENSDNLGLSLRGIDDGSTLVYCHSNCTFMDIREAITEIMEKKA